MIRILAIGAFIILFIILFPAYTNKQNQASSPALIPSPTQEIDKNTGWKINQGTSNVYGKTIKYSIKFPSSCDIKKVSYSVDYIPTLIDCSELNIEINPEAAPHGIGENPYSKITTTIENITLGINPWIKTVFRDSTYPENILTTYKLENNYMVEVIYSKSSFSDENQKFVENIIKTLQLTQ